MKLVLASGNAGKLAEFNALLADVGFDVRPQSEFGVDDAEETDLRVTEGGKADLKPGAADVGHGVCALKGVGERDVVAAAGSEAGHGCCSVPRPPGRWLTGA